MAGSFSVLEALIANGMLSLVGDPIFIGLLVAIFFTAFVIMQGLKIDGKLLGIGGGLILAAVFIPGFIIIIGLAMAFILYKAIMKLIGKG
jgi:hypothetical protein